jgi:hypothetical protein
MNNPSLQWSHWWQTATAAPPFGGQPNEGWNQTARPVYPPAAPSGLSSGILGLLAQPSNESSSYQLPKPASLLGQFLTGAGEPGRIASGKGRGGELQYACRGQGQQYGVLYAALREMP